MRIFGIADHPVVEEAPLVGASGATHGSTGAGTTRGAWAGRVRRRLGDRSRDDKDTVTLHDEHDGEDAAGPVYGPTARPPAPRR